MQNVLDTAGVYAMIPPMKLFTKAILDSLPPLYSQEKVEDPIARVKFFNPCGIGTWYLTEYDPEEKLGFGLCCLQEEELGYVSIEELEQVRLPFGLKIERDMHWKPRPLSQCSRS